MEKIEDMRQIHDIPDDSDINEIKLDLESDCRKLNTNQGFVVLDNEIKESTLRTAISRIGKKLGWKLKVKSYPNQKSYFVARIG